MQFTILHRTVYRYTAPAQSTIQTLRLTPRAEPHQRPLRWRVHAPGTLAEERDAFGNLAHVLAYHHPHREIAIEVRGEIDVDPLFEGRLDERGGVSPLVFAVDTPLTEVDAGLRAFAARHLKSTTPRGLLDFALAVSDAIAYEPGATHVRTTAAHALAQGRGVCQDHAHVFIAGCRASGIPARYVSGYFYTQRTPHAASHAWADAWLPDAGWVSIDITHRGFAGDALCRLAVGRDYDSACPVRGMRVGGGEESMEVRVNMQPLLASAAAGAREIA
jgi:transglutaminase-like putative cysteine protease